jgi:hypothetical protein
VTPAIAGMRRRLAVAVPRGSRGIAVVLVVIVLLGGGLRAASAANPDLANPSSDERGYAAVAIGFVHGHGGSLHWPPGAPAMFAVAQKLYPTPELRAAYWAQAVVGTALVPVVFWLGLLVWGPGVGLIAAALIAIYPPYVTLAGQLLSEPLGTLTLAGGVAALLAAWRLRRLWLFALAGALMGATVLVRADLIAIPVIAVALTGWFSRALGPRQAVTAALGVAVAALVVVLPWTAYATLREGHLVPVTEGEGAALFVGTYLPGDGTTFGMKRELAPAVRARYPRYAHVDPHVIPASVVLRLVADRHPELPRDRALRREAGGNLRRYAGGRPPAFARMMVVKASRMWLVSSRAGIKTKSELTRALHFVAVIVLAVTLAGAWVMRRRPPLTLIIATLAYATLLHAVFVSKPRYALPLLPLLIVGGLAGAAELLAARPGASRLRASPEDRRGAAPSYFGPT